MGYYTRYEGSVTGQKELVAQFEEDAANGAVYGEYEAPLEEWVGGELFGGDTVKWYSWENDLLALSQQYPALLFSLSGEGEEAGDIWKAWARDGRVKVVRAQIVIEEPDLERDLPAPDIGPMLAEVHSAKIAEMDEQIAALQAQRDALAK